MNRKDFIKRIGLGVLVATVAPTVFAEKENFTESPDIKPWKSTTDTGVTTFRDMTPQEFLDEWKRTGRVQFEPDGTITSKTYLEHEAMITERMHRAMCDAIWGVPLK